MTDARQNGPMTVEEQVLINELLDAVRGFDDKDTKSDAFRIMDAGDKLTAALAGLLGVVDPEAREFMTAAARQALDAMDAGEPFEVWRAVERIRDARRRREADKEAVIALVCCLCGDDILPGETPGQSVVYKRKRPIARPAHQLCSAMRIVDALTTP